MMNHETGHGAAFGAELVRGSGLAEQSKFTHIWQVECFDRDGNLKWRDHFKNTVVNEGLDDILTNYWKGSAYTAAHYVGLTDGTPTVAPGDTLASHAGWTEVTDYTEGVRQDLTLGAVSSQSVDNSASKASFSINATATVGGAFIATSTDNTGVLVAAGAFSGGDKGVSNGDTLNVTVTLTAASA